MSTFSQWWTTFNKNHKIHQHYWICGEETVLVDEVVQLIKNTYEVSEWNKQTFVLGLDSETDIWNHLFADAIDSQNSLTIVRRANELQNKELIRKLIRDKLPNHVVAFISTEPKIERVRVVTESGENKTILPSHLEDFEKRGKIVECSAFTQSSAKTAVNWIKTKVDAKDGALVHLLNESGGDLKLIRDILEKLKWLREPASIRNVNYFLSGSADSEFSEAVLRMEKDTALKALRKINNEEILQTIGHLDAQVELAGKIHDMMNERRTIPEIMKAVGSQGFLVPQLSKSAKYYSRDRRLRIRVLITEVDKLLRRGNRTGVLESLVVLW